jgi:hypothetical protein
MSFTCQTHTAICSSLKQGADIQVLKTTYTAVGSLSSVDIDLVECS